MTAAPTSTRVHDVRAARARSEESGELLEQADAALRDAIAAHDAAALEAIADPARLFVDSLWALRDPRGHTLHGKAAGTVVVVAPRT